MTTTMTSYQAVTRNLTQSLARTAAKPGVASDTAYFEKNIGKVKNLDDFMKDDRLYRYATEAFGLGDMAYAKALMRKVLEGGVSSPSSFANRMSDQRYRDFAAAFDFAAEKTETSYFEANISKVKTVTGFVADSAERMFDYAIEAFGLESVADTPQEKAAITAALHLGEETQLRFSDPKIDKAFRDFLKAFDFAGKNVNATSDKAMMQATVERHNAAERATQAKVTVEKYTRQRLERDEGASNENVRLALYFERKAPQIKDAYQVMADPALLKVVQTALGLPKEVGGIDIDKQAAIYSKRIDFKDFQDPAKLKTFLTRFAALADSAGGASASPVSLLFQPASAGVGQDVLASLQKLRLGGL
ncbi:DUF1217 domain-containing protein [Bosea sp. PAMC 26642]|uniref:DUF1217 domain-containing protein n=1 Tax=Bosea sp. (strain PAMC 26642) TaxID=1792307 RepID=UPI00077017D5|nr:DUF1217 domain-containing protein [Bosea sp. PAMC 26642]AMJ62649.1 hypothetical protein AXW83_22230 [Bosea sp. PAMC 26642]